MYEVATGYEPFPFQQRLAENCDRVSTIRVPTGLGKTAAVFNMWVYNRFFAESSIKSNTPRRFVYCLPMRSLVEQTKANVDNWLSNLEGVEGFEKPDVVVLMGGEEATEWDIHPENDVVVIGTQDMLLSRALNRGYGMSKYRWPVHFGLLNNDCLWVLDEVQLMGSGAKTGLQLQAFREKFGLHFPSRTIQMSATISEKNPSDFELNEDDFQNSIINKRVSATKSIEEIDSEEAVSKALEAYEEDKKIILILNTVDRAVSTYKKIKKKTDSCVLLHSRFRPHEKQQLKEKMESDECKIIVSTQVIEAGVDISSDVLITEVSPWSSLVQRFGRCNRRGESEEAKIYWMDVKKALPYESEDVDDAKDKLNHIDSAAVKNIESVPLEKPEYRHVLRDSDIVDLFDTTSDLTGNEVDVSHFIREGDERDFNVFWRDFSKEDIGSIGPSPSREELCRAPIGDAKKLAEKDAWVWDYYEGRWYSVGGNTILTPNSLVLMASSSGCYDVELGWSTSSKKKVDVLEPIVRTVALDTDSVLDKSEGSFETIAEHTANVCNLVNHISGELALNDDIKKVLHESALWHDVGKAHIEFQNRIETEGNQELFAKAPRSAWLKWNSYVKKGGRKYFRHELASALSALENGADDMTAYLVAAHHGKIRFSIRSFPNEMVPEDDRLFAKGVWDGDVLPAIDLGELKVPETVLDLSYMRMGEGPKGESWVSRMLDLRDEQGIFKLAYLEALLKAADERASKGEKMGGCYYE
jgi:CRISPR-associated endonuclease/helicase Cas3